MYTPFPDASPLSQVTMSERYETGAGTALALGVADALNTGSPALLGAGLDYLAASKRGDVLGEEEWKTSPWFREGLQWNEGMTADLAELLSQRHDYNAVRNFEYNKASGIGRAAFIAGEFIGSIPDPMNFVPIARMTGLAAKSAEVFGKAGGNVLSTAADAVIGVGLYQPVLAVEASLYQEPWDFSMALENMALAGLIGTGIGLAGVRRMAFEDRVAATSQAMAQTMDGRPVDVAQALPRGEPVSPLELKRVESLIAEVDRQLTDATPEGRALLLETRAALEGEQARLQAEAPMDMAVAQRPVAALPDVEPTTAQNAYAPVAPDEVDFSVVERRFKDMLDNKLLDDDDLAPIKAATEQKKTADAYARAYEIAGNCVMRTK